MDSDKKYEEEGKLISNAVKKGEIIDLQKLLPTAADLVKATEYCHDSNHDIMDQIALSGNHEMLRRILKTYFSDRSEENDDLRRRFLMSCQRGGKPKNFHYFSDLPPLQAIEKLALSKTEEEQLNNKIELYKYYRDFKKPTDDKNKQSAQRIMEVYETIRDAYMEVYPKTNPHRPMENERYGLAPKGEASIEVVGYTFDGLNKVSVIKEFDITYPKIRLVNIQEDQNDNEELKCPCFDINAAKFTEGKNDLAEQAFHKMDFPDAWLAGNYFLFLHKFGETYQKIHDDPIADAVIHRLNQSNGYYIFENCREKTYKGNSRGDYAGYSKRYYICIRTDMIYNEGTILHEGTHNTDLDFSNSDLYKFIATAICAHPEKNAERTFIFDNTTEAYDCSQFECESLARIPHQFFSSHNFEDDPLLKATCKIFSIYGKALIEGNNGIIDRIKHYTSKRLCDKFGYEELSQVNNLRLDYLIEKDRKTTEKKEQELKKTIEEANKNTGLTTEEQLEIIEELTIEEQLAILFGKKQKLEKDKSSSTENISGNDLSKCQTEESSKETKKEEFLNEYHKLADGKSFSSEGDDKPYQIIENEIIKCINDELKVIEKINQHPLARQIMLAPDIISHDNITEKEPLQVLIAKKIEEAKKFTSLRAKNLSDEELKKRIIKHVTSARKKTAELQQDKNNINRSLYGSTVYDIAAAETYRNTLVARYFGNKKNNDELYKYIPVTIDASDYLDTVVFSLNNIKIINDPNPETRLLPEIFPRPEYNMEYAVQKGNKIYQESIQQTDASARIEFVKNNSKGNLPVTTTRILQLLHKELNPQAKSLPEDLHFASLTQEKVKNGEWLKTVNKYLNQFTSQLENQNSSYQQAPIKDISSQSL